MAVQQIPFTRGLKDYIQYIGISETGNSVLYMEELLPDSESEQPIRYYPDELVIKFNKGEGKGGVAYIYTVWEKSLVGNSGNPISGTGKQLSMKTNDLDQSSFITKFGLPILMSMDNGFIRAILGFNNLPMFNTSTGAIIEYTLEEVGSLPTNDY